MHGKLQGSLRVSPTPTVTFVGTLRSGSPGVGSVGEIGTEVGVGDDATGK